MATKIREVYQDLRTKINQGLYPTKSQLPSENQLRQNYQVSRETIRKALARLRNDGYIQSQKGKGSIVINQQRYIFPVSGVISYKELMQRHQLNAKTTLLSQIKTILPVAAFQQLDLRLKPIAVTKLVRLRAVNEEPVIIDIDYLDQAIVPKLTRQIAEDSIYQYFEEVLHLTIAYAKKEITVEPATASDQKYLHLGPQAMVVVVRSITSLEDTTMFQYTESRHRADRFQFQDFARRR